MQFRDDLAAHAELHAARAHQAGHLVGGFPGAGVDRGQGAARVVAVKAVAEVDVEIGLFPRSEDQAERGAQEAGVGAAGIGGQGAGDLETVVVGAQAGHGAKGLGPARAVFNEQAGAGFDDVILARRRHPLARFCVVQTVEGVIVLQLQADGGVRLHLIRMRMPGVAGVDAAGDAPVRLAELVAIDRVVEKIGEVRIQLELVADQVSARFRGGVAAGPAPHAGEAVAAGGAAIGSIDGVEARQRTGVDRALRHLVGGVPLAAVGHRRHRKPVVGVALAVAQHAIELLVVVGMSEGAVVVQHFERVQQVATRDLGRGGERGTGVAVLADAGAGNAPGQAVGVGDGGAAGRGEVAFLRRIRPLPVVEARDQFGDQEIEVGPALAMRVATLVDRHVVDRGAQVGAVVEIEAAQVELVGLAFAAVLADDQPRRRFQQFARAVHGARGQLLLVDRAGVGGIGDAKLAGA